MSIQRYNPEDHPSERSGDVVECDNGDLVYYADHLAALEAERLAERAKVRKWEPIETAPMEGERQLYLACFNEGGELVEFAWNAIWGNDAPWDESPNFGWLCDGDCPDATHWAYQDEGVPPPEAERAKGEVRWLFISKHGEPLGLTRTGENVVDIHESPKPGCPTIIAENVDADRAARIVACVNALEGVKDPEQFIEDVRTVFCTGRGTHAREAERIIAALRAAKEQS